MKAVCLIIDDLRSSYANTISNPTAWLLLFMVSKSAGFTTDVTNYQHYDDPTGKPDHFTCILFVAWRTMIIHLLTLEQRPGGGQEFESRFMRHDLYP